MKCLPTLSLTLLQAYYKPINWHMSYPADGKAACVNVYKCRCMHLSCSFQRLYLLSSLQWPWVLKKCSCFEGGQSFLFIGRHVSVLLVAQSCPTLCDPMDWSPPDSSVHEIFQARILEWVAISFSRGSSQLRDRTQVSYTVGRFFTNWAASSMPRMSLTIFFFLHYLVMWLLDWYMDSALWR